MVSLNRAGPIAPAGLITGLIRIVGLLAVLLASLMLGVPGAPSSAHRAAAPGPALGAGEWAQIAPLMREAEYQATPQARADGRAAFWAPNRVNDLSLAFGPDGLTVSPWQDAAAWSLSLRAAAYGPAGAPVALAGAPALSADRQRVDYSWPGLREWYTNGAEGLKHNITLEQPGAAEQIQVDLALGGTLRPQLRSDGQAVAFVDPAGATVLDFGALYVYDAAGATLPARFGAPQDGGATLPILVEAAGAQFPITIDPLLSSPRPRLTMSPIQGGAQFGFAVATDGEVLVVGSFSEDGFRTPNKGSAYIFIRNQGGADNWGSVRKLTANDGRIDDNFGASVAVSGDVVVVGAPRHDALATNDGAAYVYERHQGGPESWGLKKKLVPSGADSGDEFGFAVAVSGGEIAVGAPNDDNAATDAGAITFFSRFAGPELSWGEVQTLRFADHAGARLGFALAMDGRTLAAGAPLTDAGAVDNGRVFVFKRDRSSAGRWQQEAFFSGGDSAAGDNFGRAVAIDGDTIIAGAPFHDVSGAADRGAAYLFSRNQGGMERWGQTRKLLMSAGAAGDRFGESVAIDNAVSVVGAPRDDDEARGLSDAGSITIYADGQQLAKLFAADRLSGDRFGFGVAISGDLVVAGAPFGDAGATDSGAAFLFTLNSETWSERRLFELSGANGYAVALDNDTLAVGTSSEFATRGAVYVFERSRGGPNAWGQARKIVNPQPGATDFFGTVLGLDGDTLVVSAKSTIFIFERNLGGADSWGERKRMTFPTPFALLVAIDGDTVVVGNTAATVAGADQAGQVEVFERNQGGRNNWGRADLMTIIDAGGAPERQGSFGKVVAVGGNTLIVSAQGAQTEEGFRPGAAYVFEREAGSTTWRFVKRLEQAQPTFGFGGALALDGDVIAVGASEQRHFVTGEILPGTVSLFQRNQGGPGSWGEIKRLPVPAEALTFGSSLALDNGLLAVGANNSDVSGNGSGAAYVYERNVGGADQWGLLASLNGSAATGNSSLGNGMALDGNNLVVGGLGSAYLFTNPLRAPTGLGLQAATRASQPGEATTVTATISGETGAPEDGGEVVALGTPQGEVSFYLNGEHVGAAPLDGQGRATISLPGLPQGVHELIARFEGNAGWAACEAPPLTLFVGVEPPSLAPEPTTVYIPLVVR